GDEQGSGVSDHQVAGSTTVLTAPSTHQPERTTVTNIDELAEDQTFVHPDKPLVVRLAEGVEVEPKAVIDHFVKAGLTGAIQPATHIDMNGVWALTRLARAKAYEPTLLNNAERAREYLTRPSATGQRCTVIGCPKKKVPHFHGNAFSRQLTLEVNETTGFPLSQYLPAF